MSDKQRLLDKFEREQRDIEDKSRALMELHIASE
jgi:hypothetical protein